MNSVLQDILGLIKRKKTKTPQDSDYIVSASYDNPKESLKPNPVMQPSLISLKKLKDWIVSSVTSKSFGQGWARYDDNQYTESAPLTLSDGVPVIMPNNASTTIDTYLNSTVQFYDPATQKMQAENEGDVYIQTIVFKASATNANQTHLHVYLASTGPIPYERLVAEIDFPKGNTITHDQHLVFQYYAGPDFVADGNQWTLRADTGGGTVDVWDIIFFIQRTYKA